VLPSGTFMTFGAPVEGRSAVLQTPGRALARVDVKLEPRIGKALVQRKADIEAHEDGGLNKALHPLGAASLLIWG